MSEIKSSLALCERPERPPHHLCETLYVTQKDGSIREYVPVEFHRYWHDLLRHLWREDVKKALDARGDAS